MSENIQPFRIEIRQADVDYLHHRLASARTEACSIPATEPFAAVLSPIAIATASSSSSSSGGRDPPVPRR